MNRLAISAALATFALLACSATWNAPLPVSPTPDAPCGVTGVVCGGGMCCAEGERCGAAGTSCPAGECCFEGGDEMAGARAPHAQRPASTNPPAH